MGQLTAPGLKGRITTVLAAAGFREHDPRRTAYDPSFTVTIGVGANVGVAWFDAPARDRVAELARYAIALADNGLQVFDRGPYLYVTEPDPQET